MSHPSIIAWVMFNEGWGQNETLRHAAWAKMLDPSRLIDEASGFPRHGGGDIIDTHGGIAPTQEGKISLDSETAGYGIEALGHSWPGVHWATGTYDPETGKEGPTDKESDLLSSQPYLHRVGDVAGGRADGEASSSNSTVRFQTNSEAGQEAITPRFPLLANL